MLFSLFLNIFLLNKEIFSFIIFLKIFLRNDIRNRGEETYFEGTCVLVSLYNIFPLTTNFAHETF